MSAAAPLFQTHPVRTSLPAQADEAALRHLYSHAPGTVRLGMIRSVDGLAAGPDGSSRSLNGPEDLRILRTLRANADVVLVGARTARQERYRDLSLPSGLAEARATDHPSSAPPVAVVTATGELPDGLTPAHTWILTYGGAPAATRMPADWHSRVLVAGNEQWDPTLALAQLFERGMNRVLCEGGPQLATLLLERDLVDDYCLTTSPHPGGAHAAAVPPLPARMARSHRLEGQGFSMERGVRRR